MDIKGAGRQTSWRSAPSIRKLSIFCWKKWYKNESYYSKPVIFAVSLKHLITIRIGNVDGSKGILGNFYIIVWKGILQ